MPLGIQKRPVLPVVRLQKNDDNGSFSSYYEYNPFTSTFNFRVQKLEFTPPIDSVGGKFKLTLVSSDASNTNANTLLSNIEEGNQVLIWIGKTNASKKQIFRGIMETPVIKEINKNFMQIVIEGPDWGSCVLKGRVVNGSVVQAKDASDPNKLDNTDTNVLLKNITVEMLTNLQWYPLFDYTIEDMGVVVNPDNIVPPEIRVAQFQANDEFADDKLAEIDRLGGTIHYVDSNKNFIMKQPDVGSADSGILLTDYEEDPVALTWPDQTKVGLISPPSEYKKTLENHRRRLLGVGGDQPKVDNKQETNSTSTKLDANYLAMKFTPHYRKCDVIQLLLSKLGSPAIGVTFELIEDRGGQPVGDVIRTLTKEVAAISGSATWINFTIGDELNTAKDYWIVLRKNGDASNTFKWHRDSTASYTNAYSADGVTWTVQNSSYGYAFRQYTSIPVLTVMQNLSSATDKHFVEEIFKQADIKDQQTMDKLLQAESDKFFKSKHIIKCPVYSPDTPLETGQLVRIRKQYSGYLIDAFFTIGQVTYTFDDSEGVQDGAMYYDIQATRYVTYS